MKPRSLHCNYLRITVIIKKEKCAKRIFLFFPPALADPLRAPSHSPPATRLHADFDIAGRSIDPRNRNASRPDYNEDSRSFKMLMANFT